MAGLTVTTNNHKRPVLNWHDLSDKECREFDWLDSDELRDSATFVRYKGRVECLDEFMRIENNPELAGWEGYSSDTYFSGLVVKFDNEDNDFVIMGMYFS